VGELPLRSVRPAPRPTGPPALDPTLRGQYRVMRTAQHHCV